MGLSLSKAKRKTQVNKVMPEISAEKQYGTRSLDGEMLPPLQISASNSKQTALPAIVPKKHIQDDRPDCSQMHVNDDDDEDEFQNALDADLQLNLDQDRTYTDDDNMQRQELKEALKRLETLRKVHEDLQESHCTLRQEMINMRKIDLDDRIASQNTLVAEETDVTALNLSRASEQHIQLLKAKMNNQRSEYSARVFEEKLKVTLFDPDVKDFSLPPLKMPKINYLEEIEDLKKQLKMKNELIKVLSMEIMRANSTESH